MLNVLQEMLDLVRVFVTGYLDIASVCLSYNVECPSVFVTGYRDLSVRPSDRPIMLNVLLGDAGSGLCVYEWLQRSCVRLSVL